MLKLFYSFDVPILRYDCLNISLNFVLKLVTRSLTHLSRTSAANLKTLQFSKIVAELCERALAFSAVLETSVK